MSRVTYKMVKRWLSGSPFATKYGMTVSAFNGYYHILDRNHNMIVSAETPGKCWQMFNLVKNGYYMAMEEMRNV